jgi:hypothetical protein
MFTVQACGFTARTTISTGSLNLTAIAEIVETESAAKAPQEMGCDYGQGYYFSEPLEAEPALQRLRSQQPFEPPKRTSATVKVPTLEVDGSPTTVIPAAKIPQPPQGTSATMKLRPLDEDDSLNEDDSPTVMMPADTIDCPPEEEPQ